MRNLRIVIAPLALLLACTEDGSRTAREPSTQTSPSVQVSTSAPHVAISNQELVRPADATPVSPGIYKKVLKRSKTRVRVENAKVVGLATEAYARDGSDSSTCLHFEPWDKLPPAWQEILRDSSEGEVLRVWYCEASVTGPCGAAGSPSSCAVVDFTIFGEVEKSSRKRT